MAVETVGGVPLAATLNENGAVQELPYALVAVIDADATVGAEVDTVISPAVVIEVPMGNPPEDTPYVIAPWYAALSK